MKISNFKKVHFVGIGGIGMSSLAQHLHAMGCIVSGSDRQENEQTAKLRDIGIVVTVPHSAECVGDAQLVVRTSAVPLDNEELLEAQSRNVPVLLREQLLGLVFDNFQQRVAVCGTHGKTTVTAMLHHVLERCNISHAAFIGGEYKGQNYFGGQNIVVAEACEYNQSFLQLHPTLCLCLNVEYDHPDCYPDLEAVEKSFCQLFSQSNQVILNQEYGHLCRDARLFNGKDMEARNVCVGRDKTNFDVFSQGQFLCHVGLGVCGVHNVKNALATLAAARQLNLPLLQAAQALGSFCGVDRRWTAVEGRLNVVCDYAHHPTEIKATVSTAKGLCKGKVICVFQPHTYSRTKAFWQQFIDCFADADNVVYLPIYAAREKPLFGVTSQNLCRDAERQGINALYCSDFISASRLLLDLATTDDLVLLIGAGDVNKLAKLLI